MEGIAFLFGSLAGRENISLGYTWFLVVEGSSENLENANKKASIRHFRQSVIKLFIYLF